MKKVLLSLYFISCFALFAQESSNPFLGDAMIEDEQTSSTIGRIDIDSVRAMEQFSWGVRAFHSGLYNKALLDFESSVRLKPDEPLYRLWLGNANFATGLDDLAIRQWQDVTQNDRINNGWLISRIQTLLFRSSPYQDNLDQDEWTVRHEITGRNPRTVRFSGPTDLSSDPLGTHTYVAGYMSNNIAVFNVNGDLRNRFNGGIMQLDGPWGVLAMDDGNLFVSEFRGQRITLLNSNGRRLLTFGSGLDDGNLQGPQYMTSTEDGYLYVSDWVGNKVVKYDFNGKYILTIGLPSGNFAGLRQPSGIAATATELYVVDTKDKIIHVFDHSGNYLRSLGRGVFHQPEQIKIINNRILVADGKRVLDYNLATDNAREATNLHNKSGRIVSLDIDRNGTIVIADQEHERISFLVHRSELYGGFFLNVHQVNSDQFPKVQLVASVQSRSGQPVLGLNQGNFLVTENGIELSSTQVQSLDQRANGAMSSIILIENSPKTQEQESLVLRAIQNLTQSFSEQDNFGLVWATEQPIYNELRNSQEALLQFQRVFPTLKQFGGRFDRGLRLAGSHLINRNARSAIFYITSGQSDNNSINQYSILDLASYLKNNNIAFYPIYLNQTSSNPAYDAIAKETGGESFYLLRPRGLSEVVDIARSRAAGLYLLSYDSMMPSNHGKDYINLSLMAAIQSQSGLTQSGYFPPISVVR